MKKKKSSSILKKFLLFNLTIFSILGLFTIVYLKAIQPSLVKKTSSRHYIIIKNTTDHIERLGIDYNKDDIKQFLLSTRFLFQSLDRVQFFSTEGDLIGDTNILDLDSSVFEKSQAVIQEGTNSIDTNNRKIEKKSSIESKVKKIINEKYENEVITIEDKINNSFFVSTISELIIKNKREGFIVVTNEADDILIAIEERKNFIIRTVLAIALVILIFSLFLNKYILKPIGFLVSFTESIKNKSDQNIDIKKFFVREDEVGKLTKSIDEMTKELQKRTQRAETFSTDLAHEIRNPLASLKGASELLNKTENSKDRNKLFEIINHDVERIERLITDYTQMLKDEASLSREKMSKVNLMKIILNVVEDFRQDLKNQNKNIELLTNLNNKEEKNFFIVGIENRLEQVIANLLDNAISFSENNQKIEINLTETSNNLVMTIKDQGPGFTESSTQKIFKRFYSNRPSSFGEHSGLGLNIAKNIVELHKGAIAASNRLNQRGAQIEVLLPKI